MKTLLFIPARGGSKGIKNKNLLKIKNKPLIKYTIEFAQKFQKHEIFVSTDSDKILNYCRKLGVKMNYKRPKKFSTSTSSMYDTVMDAIYWLNERGKFYDNVLVLQPTNPLRDRKDLEKIFKIFKSKKLTSLASVTQMREHPYECVYFDKKQWKYLKKPKKKITRRQDYTENNFFIDGTYYLLNVSFLKKSNSFISLKKTYFYKLSNKWPIDIDYLDDVKVAKSFL